MGDAKPCPCGETPEALHISGDYDGCKWATVSAVGCCGEWEINFRNGHHAFDSAESKRRAVEAWNAAPRGERVSRVDDYIASVDGAAHQSAVEIITAMQQEIAELKARIADLEKVAEESALKVLIDFGQKRISAAAYNQIVENLRKALRSAGYLKGMEGE
jgi:hypothetical protein